MSANRIAVIGAAGEMCSIAVERLGAHHPDWNLALYDLNTANLARVAASLPPGRVTRGPVDLFDPAGLRDAIAGADLVVLGAGPYMRTAEPVLRACIEAGADYLDFDDDIESTQAALALGEQARQAGIACYIGCGASPGMSNVMAADVAGQLDQLDTLDVCWCTGDEGARPYGPAVIEHLLHIAAGPCLTWRDGEEVTVETFAASEVFPMGGGLGDYRLYEVAHPESVTLPRKFPHARSIRVMGGLDPQPVNGLSRGVAQAVLDGKLSTAEAIAWFNQVMQDKNGSAKGWRYALRGMWEQVRRGETRLGAMLGFLWAGARKKHPPYRGGLLATATGIKDGTPVRVTRRTPASGPGTYLWDSMGAATGSATAAFIALALGQRGERAGVLCPEDWVSPPDFYAALTRLGAPPHEVIDPGYEITALDNSPSQHPRPTARPVPGALNLQA